jgi:hypothetical protein
MGVTWLQGSLNFLRVIQSTACRLGFISSERIHSASARIYYAPHFFLREQKVLLDADLAALYGVETKVLLQAVKRNLERFPEDFMFRLTNQEVNVLRSQSVTSSSEALETPRWGGRRTAPYAFQASCSVVPCMSRRVGFCDSLVT